jgi:hypothetical protein
MSMPAIMPLFFTRGKALQEFSGKSWMQTHHFAGTHSEYISCMHNYILQPENAYECEDRPFREMKTCA